MSYDSNDLGSSDFKRDYKLKHAYMSGAMYKGISSKELVVRMGKANLMGSLGTGGLGIERVARDIESIQNALRNGESYCINLLHSPDNPKLEMDLVNLYLKYNVRCVEASGFMGITPALAMYRLQGASLESDGRVVSKNKIIAKISRPEIAEAFLKPIPSRITAELVNGKLIGPKEANLATRLSIADDLCVEADSGGHTDGGNMLVLLPTILRLRTRILAETNAYQKVRVGAAGGLGTPEAIAAVFLLGADFVLTGSINQCTVEAETSDQVKSMLANAGMQDMTYAPAGDMFELGAKAQVLKRGVLFPSRANKLYDLWRQFNSFDQIDDKTKLLIEKKYFGRTFDDVYQETKEYLSKNSPNTVKIAEKNPKVKMALVFRWYFIHSNRLAKTGDPNKLADYQIHTGPAMGAFNSWVKGTRLEDWKNRHVDNIAEKLISDASRCFFRNIETEKY